MRGFTQAILLAALAAGCNALTGVSALERTDDGVPDASLGDDGGGDAGGVTCGPGTKLCGTVCVSIGDPLYGCAGVADDGTCVPCPSGPFVASVACDANSGKCAAATCDQGHADCNVDTADGCETDIQTSPVACGGCGKACTASAPLCSAGTCVAACPSTTTRCGNSCVDTTTSAVNCGSCGKICPSGPNSTPTCTGGVCGLRCGAGYGDCDKNAVTGCEANVTSTATCGAACVACGTRANAIAGCTGGACTYACKATYQDCNGDLAALGSNGCECATSASLVCAAGECCKPLGAACAAGDDCCGSADASASCTFTIAGRTCCKAPDQLCTKDAECCSNHCRAVGRCS